MWTLLAGAALVVAIIIWALLTWRSFGAAEAKQRAARTAQSDKYSRSLHSGDDAGEITPRKPRRQFGRR